ncbi:MAG TPA: BtrH N-terminal domain-containing protein, partial [Pseudonocardiaceae bacterium]
MTTHKHLKERIRARMARTGERYTAARRHVLGAEAAGPGGPGAGPGAGRLVSAELRHPESAAVAALLARHGRTLSEPMALGCGGGLAAGYILWEFTAHAKIHLVLGFRNRWNYLDWTENALTALGAEVSVHTTSGVKGAHHALDAALATGPAVTWPDRYVVGYWGLPEHLDGHGGHAVLALGLTGNGDVLLDDRTFAPLTVDRAVFDAARARVSSYRNRLVTVTGVGPVDLAAAARAGIEVTLAGLGGTSASFALPAWRKWARLLTDERHAKGWPRVFADGRGLVGALLSVWEGVSPAGADGGHLRDVYADFLDEAAALLGNPALTRAAAAFREAGERWTTVGETALPAAVPAYQRLRTLTAELAMAVAEGDAGADARAAAAAEL